MVGADSESGSGGVHLELFGGAGGTAHGVALAMAPAGIAVWSVDNAVERHARNPYAWFTGDWREGLDRALQTGRVVSIGAAPPCTKNSAGTRALDRSRYDNDPDLENVREVLIATGLPYFIENVESEVTKRKMRSPLRLCGFEFNLTAVDDDGTVLHLKRHRLFESNVPLVGAGGCPGHPRKGGPQIAGAYGGARRDKVEARTVRKGGYVPPNIKVLRALLGAPAWMTEEEDIFLSVPPAYGEHVGRQLLAHIRGEVAA